MLTLRRKRAQVRWVLLQGSGVQEEKDILQGHAAHVKRGKNDTKQAKWNKHLDATEGEASLLRLQEDERSNDDQHQGNAHQWDRGQERHCNGDKHCVALKHQSDEHCISHESETSDKGTSAVFTTDYELSNVKGTELFALETGKDITKPYYVYCM